MALNLEKITSIPEFKNNIDKTHLFIHGLHSNVVATETFLNSTKAKDKPDYIKFKELIEFDKGRISYLYEVGFITLFSNFEFFQFNLLRELFIKYPNSFRKEKLVCLEEIIDFKNIQEIKEYFADLFATEKSYDIKSWSDFLDKKFGIKIFRTQKQFKRFLMLNALRNNYMHSGGTTNAKFRNEMKSFIKAKVPIGQKINLDREKFFESLYQDLCLIFKNIGNKSNKN